MAVSIQQHYLEAVTKNKRETIQVRGTRFRVAEIILMHLRQGSSIDWMVENFESLNHARIHAALAYYYDNQAAIDTEIDTIQAADDALARDAMTLDKLKAKIQTQSHDNE